MNPEELVRQMQFSQPSAQLNPESQVKADSRLASLWNAIKNTPRALSNAFVYNEQTQRPFPASPLYPENHDMTNAAEIANISLGMVGALTPVRSIMGAQKAVGAVDDIAQQAGKLDPLTQEARKYKSAEEFVKAQGKPIYHGTAAKFDVFDDTMKGSVTDAKSAHGATWFTDDPDVAKAYSVYAAEDGPINKLMKEHKVLERTAQISKKEADWAKVDELTRKIDEMGGYDATYQRRLANANVKEAVAKGDFYKVDAKGKTPQELSADGDIDSWLNLQVNKAKRLEKDGLIIKNIDDAVGLYNRPSTHYAFFDAKNILTKSQLTDIFNKAHGINNK